MLPHLTVNSLRDLEIDDALDHYAKSSSWVY